MSGYAVSLVSMRFETKVCSYIPHEENAYVYVTCRA